MQTIVAVGRELWYFVFSEQFGLNKQRSQVVSEYTAMVSAATERVNTERSSAVPVEPLLPAPALAIGEVAYITLPQTPLHMFPAISVDGVVAELPYASKVLVTEQAGRFAKVTSGTLSGWVTYEALTQDERTVTPKLHDGVTYYDTHADTIAIRASIKDVFNVILTELPLQDIEYVLYRLTLRNVQVPWTSERPRTAGSWQRILRGQTGVHISISPKTDAVFEIINDDGSGEVAYVDAVYPDQSIQLSRITAGEPGTYKVETMPLVVWRELRPVFITIA